MLRTAIFWSGGKDAALALAAERADPDVAVAALVTTVTDEPEPVVPIHEVPLGLIEAQAEALGLPLLAVPIPRGASNVVYEAMLADALAPLREGGVEALTAGDVSLEDVRAYREALCTRLGFAVRFPLWGVGPDTLAQRFIETDGQALLASVDPSRLDDSFVGRPYDAALLDALPEDVDLCGERGAFHTFVTWTPGFARAVEAEVVGHAATAHVAHARWRIG